MKNSGSISQDRHDRIRIRTRAAYGVMGWICGMAVALLSYFAWKADPVDFVIVPLSTMSLALWYGESRGKIPTAEEARRPISLFSEDSPTQRR